MSNYFLKTDQKIAIVAALAEGNSIRSTERMTGCHRDTIMRLGVRIGQGCARLLDEKMRNLDCHRLELDEIWGYVGKKARHVKDGDDPTMGDVWTYCAIDSDTKLVPSYHVSSSRNHKETIAFITDLASRLNNRVQISTDAMNSYEDAIEIVYGSEVDYAQIVKTYQSEDGSAAYNPERRYSQPRIASSKKRVFSGNPERALISTSYVERLNASTRLHMKRLARLTHAFSKKYENFEAAVALNFASHNFVKTHRTLKMTPAMAAGVERDFWSYGENHDQYIEELKAAILNVHGADATHVETVPVTEEFEGETVWQGEVEVFTIRGHPKAKRVYGWGFIVNENQGRKYVAVLEIPPVDSPQTAVKIAIAAEIKNAKQTKTSRPS